MARVLFLDRFSILEWSPHGRSWPPRAGPGSAPWRPRECPGTCFGLKDLQGRSRDRFWSDFLARGEVLGTTFDRFRTGLSFAQNYCEPAPGRSVVFHPIATFYDWLALGLTPFCPHLPKCVDLCAEHPPRPGPPVVPFSIDILDQISRSNFTIEILDRHS